MKKILVLFLIITIFMCTFVYSGYVSNEIGWTLSNVESGGFSRTQEFTLMPDEIISSLNFDERGFDATQIIVYGGEFEGVNVESGFGRDTKFSYLKSISPKSIKVKADVYCDATGEALKTMLEIALNNEVSYSLDNIDTTFCTKADAQPCCAVIVQSVEDPRTRTSSGIPFTIEFFILAGLVVIFVLLLALIIKFRKNKRAKIGLSVLLLLFILFVFIMPLLFAPVMAKPAIYLYPEETTPVNVNLNLNGWFTQTIPDYGLGWDVTAEPNGLIDSKYDYLFYEMKLFTLDYDLPNEGWVVKTSELELFFDEKLSELGMNEKEIFDFKEYWLEHLSEAEYYEIKLFSNEFLEQNLELNVNPLPDSILRLIFHFKPLNDTYELKAPIFASFERNGFVVVEWGGLLAN
ncbi:MAG: hypothetical protein HOE11_02495 [Candidatus Diapherotrites archaeon]|jgi:hypothetical protein|nr:hypothetical protein [Candidatus Diapherotrites archaeon]MBT4597283.1 hypothetical protein [Candidatus Diapherotrites archaeon]